MNLGALNHDPRINDNGLCLKFLLLRFMKAKLGYFFKPRFMVEENECSWKTEAVREKLEKGKFVFSMLWCNYRIKMQKSCNSILYLSGNDPWLYN